MKVTFSTVSGILGLAVIFITAGLFANKYATDIASVIQSHGTIGEIFFIGMAMLAVIIPVWSNMFLLPFGVVTWGPFFTGVLCVVGWWFGSVISFYIARSYKDWLLTKYPSLKKYEFIDSLIPRKHTSISLIFLRMTMPVDVLSYGLGLFSKRITWRQNAITTLIGIIPFTFVFSYIGVLNVLTQIGIFIITISALTLFILIQKKKNQSGTQQQ